MNIYPSILTDSISTAQAQLDLVSSWEQIELVQMDIIDGQFADEVTITPLDLLDLDFHQLKLDLHLMVEEPLDFVYETITVKSKLPIRAIIAQVERMSHIGEYLKEVRRQGWGVGLSLNLLTPIEEVAGYLSELDVLQLMTIEAGAQGLAFDKRGIDKIQIENLKYQIKSKLNKLELIVDGGVKTDNVAQIKAADIDSVCVGSGLWKAEDLEEVIGQLAAG